LAWPKQRAYFGQQNACSKNVIENQTIDFWCA